MHRDVLSSVLLSYWDEFCIAWLYGPDFSQLSYPALEEEQGTWSFGFLAFIPPLRLVMLGFVWVWSRKACLLFRFLLPCLSLHHFQCSGWPKHTQTEIIAVSEGGFTKSQLALSHVKLKKGGNSLFFDALCLCWGWAAPLVCVLLLFLALTPSVTLKLCSPSYTLVEIVSVIV